MSLRTSKENFEKNPGSMIDSSSYTISVGEYITVSTKLIRGRAISAMTRQTITANQLRLEYVITQYAKTTFSMEATTAPQVLSITGSSTYSNSIEKIEEEEKRLILKKKVEEWRRFMLENPPPEPESIASTEEWDYYDEEYAKRKLGVLS